MELIKLIYLKYKIFLNIISDGNEGRSSNLEKNYEKMV